MPGIAVTISKPTAIAATAVAARRAPGRCRPGSGRSPGGSPRARAGIAITQPSTNTARVDLAERRAAAADEGERRPPATSGHRRDEGERGDRDRGRAEHDDGQDRRRGGPAGGVGDEQAEQPAPHRDAAQDARIRSASGGYVVSSRRSVASIVAGRAAGDSRAGSTKWRHVVSHRHVPKNWPASTSARRTLAAGSSAPTSRSRVSPPIVRIPTWLIVWSSYQNGSAVVDRRTCRRSASGRRRSTGRRASPAVERQETRSSRASPRASSRILLEIAAARTVTITGWPDGRRRGS